MNIGFFTLCLQVCLCSISVIIYNFLLHHIQFLDYICYWVLFIYRYCEWDCTHNILFNKHIICVTNFCVLILCPGMLTNLSTLVSSSLSSGFTLFHKEQYLSFLFLSFIYFSLKNLKKFLFFWGLQIIKIR